MTTLDDRLRSAASRLTPAERKVADVIVSDPQAIAFGTVAELAERAGASGASVIRLSVKLGFAGFSELQTTVRDELGRRLRPAIEKINDPRPSDPLAQGLSTSLTCVADSFAGVTPEHYAEMVALLATGSSAVWVISGDAADGIARQFATELAMLRPSVHHITGSPVHVSRLVANVADGDIVVALDLQRYDQWVLDALEIMRAAGAALIALTDGPLSPVATGATHLVSIEADDAGPFDNYVGALAVLSSLVAGVAVALRTPAAARLAGIERAWAATHALASET